MITQRHGAWLLMMTLATSAQAYDLRDKLLGKWSPDCAATEFSTRAVHKQTVLGDIETVVTIQLADQKETVIQRSSKFQTVTDTKFKLIQASSKTTRDGKTVESKNRSETLYEFTNANFSKYRPLESQVTLEDGRSFQAIKNGVGYVLKKDGSVVESTTPVLTYEKCYN